MSTHERERLSAYLDRELPPEERAAVDVHLAACRECAAFLAELEAADRAAAELPAEAPHGYFDGFAARVVERIGVREAPPRPRRAPAWAWAVAAALLLAVVTPLTLRQSPTAPAEAPGPTAPVRPALSGSAERAPSPGSAEPKVTSGLATASAPAAVPEGETLAPSRGARDEAGAERDFAREPAGPLPAPAPPGAAVAVPPAPLEEAASQAPASAAGLAGPDTREKGVRERVQALAGESTLAPPDRGAESAALAAAAGAGDPAHAFLRLEAQRPRSAEGWRRLRDDWGAFVAAYPDSPRADEARVRGIEAGHEAWLADRDPDDEAAFRRDARAYLERADARQVERVRRLGTSEP